MTLTLVTSLYDLSKRGVTTHRNVDWLFANSCFVLEELPQHLVVYTEPELEIEIRKRRGDKPITVVTTPYETLLGADRIAQSIHGQLQHNATRTKVTPAYVQLMWAKYNMLLDAASLYADVFQHLGWIDIAITHVGKVTPNLANEIFANPPSKPRVHMLRYFNENDVEDPQTYWQHVHGHLAGGLVVGSTSAMRELVWAFKRALDHAAVYKLAPLDEGILSYIVGRDRARYSYSYGDYVDILRNHDQVRAGLTHLTWQIQDAETRGAHEHAAVVLERIPSHLVDGDPILKKLSDVNLNKPLVVVDTIPKLLGLVMIVKNEAHGIAQTINTFKSHIQHWTILDTGSTDGTQDIIRTLLADVPGTLYEEPFVDFSTSRNRALDLHGQATTFSIMPDADDRLVGGHILARALRTLQLHVDDAAFLINLDRPPLSYWLPLVLRTTAGWRYRGRVHEVLGPGLATTRLEGVQLRQEYNARSIEASAKRWERDLLLLREEYIANPSDPRTLFYLAQTYECLGRPADALPAYERRIEIGGWIEETVEAMLRRAKILNALKRPWAQVQQAFLDAYTLDPRRAEPLFYIAEHWYAEGNHALCTLFASRAAKLRPVATALFIEQDIYTYRAANLVAISGFYCDAIGEPGIRREGQQCAVQAVRAQPNEEQFRANWAFYARSVTEMFEDATIQPIELNPPAPYTASNPSIYCDRETGRWYCIVRTTNYTIVDGQYLTPDDNIIYTRNWLCELNRSTLKITHAMEMDDCTGRAISQYPVHGFEDCRLFKHNGQFYFSSTVCDTTESGERELVIGALEPGYDRWPISRAWPIRGPWSQVPQKNWMPIIGGRNQRFVYGTGPQTLLEFALNTDPTLVKATYAAKVVSNESGILPSELADFPVDAGRLRGGSQVIAVPGGWLCITHDVAWPGKGRIYLHRFVFMNDDFVVQSMSDPFYFKRLGIEFCAGLGYDGDKLVASFSVEDREAHLVRFDLTSVMAELRTDYQI